MTVVRVLSCLVAFASGLISPASSAIPTGDLTVMTMNTALFSQSQKGITTRPQRRAALTANITGDPVRSETDVACMQELRVGDDYDVVSSALRQAGFVHQFSFRNFFGEPSPGERACNDQAALFALLACGAAMSICHAPHIATNGPLFSICVFYGCPAQVNQITQSCLECLTDSRRPAEQALNVTFLALTCLAAPATAYRPSLSVLLASRLPMTNLEAVPFKGNRTTYLQYGYLRGDVSLFRWQVDLLLLTILMVKPEKSSSTQKRLNNERKRETSFQGQHCQQEQKKTSRQSIGLRICSLGLPIVSPL